MNNPNRLFLSRVRKSIQNLTGTALSTVMVFIYVYGQAEILPRVGENATNPVYAFAEAHRAAHTDFLEPLGSLLGGSSESSTSTNGINMTAKVMDAKKASKLAAAAVTDPPLLKYVLPARWLSRAWLVTCMFMFLGVLIMMRMAQRSSVASVSGVALVGLASVALPIYAEVMSLHANNVPEMPKLVDSVSYSTEHLHKLRDEKIAFVWAKLTAVAVKRLGSVFYAVIISVILQTVLPILFPMVFAYAKTPTKMVANSRRALQKGFELLQISLDALQTKSAEQVEANDCEQIQQLGMIEDLVENASVVSEYDDVSSDSDSAREDDPFAGADDAGGNGESSSGKNVAKRHSMKVGDNNSEDDDREESVQLKHLQESMLEQHAQYYKSFERSDTTMCLPSTDSHIPALDQIPEHTLYNTQFPMPSHDFHDSFKQQQPDAEMSPEKKKKSNKSPNANRRNFVAQPSQQLLSSATVGDDADESTIKTDEEQERAKKLEVFEKERYLLLTDIQDLIKANNELWDSHCWYRDNVMMRCPWRKICPVVENKSRDIIHVSRQLQPMLFRLFVMEPTPEIKYLPMGEIKKILMRVLASLEMLLCPGLQEAPVDMKGESAAYFRTSIFAQQLEILSRQYSSLLNIILEAKNQSLEAHNNLAQLRHVDVSIHTSMFHSPPTGSGNITSKNETAANDNKAASHSMQNSSTTKASSTRTRVRYDIAQERMAEIWRYQALLRDLLLMNRDLIAYTHDLIHILLQRDEAIHKHADNVFKKLEKKVNAVRNEMGGAFGCPTQSRQ